MKKSLVFALALMLVLVFASSAMAAQVSTLVGTYATYKSTATGVYYDSLYTQAGQFTADGTTNYPYEIYIPNELNPGEYRIHSSYAKNTDACASCHSTHTAVGNTLLQWYSTYETCMACHDGTVTTTYNVVEGEYVSQSGLKVTAMGGAFGDEGSAFSSNHNVTGALSISAAPGGSTTPETVTLANGPQSRWTPTFGCESCHTPHGAGGNARILHPDTNFVASQAAEAVTTGYDVVGGVVYKGAIESGNEAYLLKGYPYTISIQSAGIEVPGAYIDNTAGYSVVVGGVAEKVYGTPSLKVAMSIDNYLSYEDTDEKEVVNHVYGMNFFCGACHTDYNTAAFTTEHSSDQSLGEYSKAHRHQVGVAPTYNNPANGNTDNLPQATMVLEGGNLECLTCHVAHGVNADFWKKTVGSTGTAYLEDGDLEELAGSSALKRLPNMGTCEACHQKGASAEGYAVPTLASDNGTQADAVFSAPAIFPGQPVPTNLNWVGASKCAPCHAEKFATWKATKHAKGTSNAVNFTTTGGRVRAFTNGTCGDSMAFTSGLSCHSIGYQVKTADSTLPLLVGATYGGSSLAVPGLDAAVTCEACHNSGAKHIQSPSAKNIFNPGRQTADQQTLFCAKCHDANVDSSTNINVNAVFSLTGLYLQHAGGFGFAQSDHKTQGLTCTTCHDTHEETAFASPELTAASPTKRYAIKLDYLQLCSSCHDSVGTLTETMNGAGREASNHAFKFGYDGTDMTLPVEAEITAPSVATVTYGADTVLAAPSADLLAKDGTTVVAGGVHYYLYASGANLDAGKTIADIATVDPATGVVTVKGVGISNEATDNFAPGKAKEITLYVGADANGNAEASQKITITYQP